MVRNAQGSNDPETVTLQIPLLKRVAQDLVALAELYHATPEQMVASWAQTHVNSLMAGLTPSDTATGDHESAKSPDAGRDEYNHPRD